jgi:hypothetical protein
MGRVAAGRAPTLAPMMKVSQAKSKPGLHGSRIEPVLDSAERGQVQLQTILPVDQLQTPRLGSLTANDK